jgi:hypothetical protein
LLYKKSQSSVRFAALLQGLIGFIAIPAAVFAAAADPWVRVAQVDVAGLEEASGLAVSRVHDNVLWTHNDSGHRATLYALDTSGRLRARVEVAAQVLDWEDLASFEWRGQPWLALADTGDNFRLRAEGTIYLLPEPALSATLAVPQRTLRFRYPDGAHDVEAVAVDVKHGVILLLEKRRPPAQLYALRLDGPEQQNAVPIGTLPELGHAGADGAMTRCVRRAEINIAAMDLSADGLTLSLLSATGLLQFHRPDVSLAWPERLGQWPDACTRTPRGGAIYEATTRDAQGRSWVLPEGGRPLLIYLPSDPSRADAPQSSPP